MSKLTATLQGFALVILIALVALQTYRLGKLETRLSTLQANTIGTPQISSEGPSTPTAQSQNLSSQSLALIRGIIREELESQISGDNPRAARPSSGSMLTNPNEIATVKAQADAQINFILDQGSASPAEIANAFGLLNQLPTAERQDAIDAFNKGLRNGQIEFRY